jgi:hypothetical protein
MTPMRMLLLGLILLSLVDHASAQTALDLLPQDAVGSIAIRNLDDLIKKGDDFLTKTAIRMPIRPSELFDQGAQAIGVTKVSTGRRPLRWS